MYYLLYEKTTYSYKDGWSEKGDSTWGPSFGVVFESLETDDIEEVRAKALKRWVDIKAENTGMGNHPSVEKPRIIRDPDFEEFFCGFAEVRSIGPDAKKVVYCNKILTTQMCECPFAGSSRECKISLKVLILDTDNEIMSQIGEDALDPNKLREIIKK